MSDDNPYFVFTQAYINWVQGQGEAPSLPVLKDCLIQAQDKRQPLPDVILCALIQSVDNLMCGRADNMLMKADVQRDTHSVVEYKQFAISYIQTCKKHGYDDHPVKTVCELFGVDDRTIRRWKKEHINTNDGLDKQNLLFELEIHSSYYRDKKGMPLLSLQEEILRILKSNPT